ncbi:hypothetical protein [Microbispora bryophytorum]|uniref:hypothetical protein n=1 Tax=Microbispora bryophytorum TaxID=1460882 RepID=UPI00371E7694
MEPRTSFIVRLVGALARIDQTPETHELSDHDGFNGTTLASRVIAALAHSDAQKSLESSTPIIRPVIAKSSAAIADNLARARPIAQNLTRRPRARQNLARALVLSQSRRDARDLALAMTLAIADDLAITLGYIRRDADMHATELRQALGNDLTRSATRAHTLGHVLDQAVKVEKALLSASALALTLAQPSAGLLGSPHHMRQLLDRVDQLKALLQEAQAIDYASKMEHANALIDTLARGLTLDLSHTDLRDADLSNINLTILKLAGALWSETTQWPPNTKETVRMRSTELEPGLFRIRPEEGVEDPIRTDAEAERR